ncbi:pyridoxal-phosphate dependent enzyme [bacterium]|nr:pyridoxal-phosphate dependent enzyme [bacterium]
MIESAVDSSLNGAFSSKPRYGDMRTGMDQNSAEPVIFRWFPEFRGRIPWVDLGLQPTPIEPLPGFGHGNLWIKRDDRSSSIYGGNKIRKLEFSLGEALQQGKKRVVTFGAIGTNHGLATAIFCDILGLDCTILLFDQPVTLNVKNNLWHLCSTHADIVYKQSLFRTVLDYFVKQRVRFLSTYFLAPGGSNTVGTIGYVNAALELKEQVDCGLMPEPACIFCPVGSSGTMAGLLLGCQLAGLETTVVGVRVSLSHFGPFAVCTAGAIRKLAQQTYRYLKDRSPNLPEVSIPAPVLLDEYLGAGYGHPTLAGGDAHEQMKTRKGISLDPCYTSKAFAAALDHCRKDQDQRRSILFWNTYNSVELPQPVAASDQIGISPELRAFLNRSETVGYPEHDPKPRKRRSADPMKQL